MKRYYFRLFAIGLVAITGLLFSLMLPVNNTLESCLRGPRLGTIRKFIYSDGVFTRKIVKTPRDIKKQMLKDYPNWEERFYELRSLAIIDLSPDSTMADFKRCKEFLYGCNRRKKWGYDSQDATLLAFWTGKRWVYEKMFYSHDYYFHPGDYGQITEAEFTNAFSVHIPIVYAKGDPRYELPDDEKRTAVYVSGGCKYGDFLKAFDAFFTNDVGYVWIECYDMTKSAYDYDMVLP